MIASKQFTCSSITYSNFIGNEMNVIFGIGAVFAVIAFVCLTLLGRNLVQERKKTDISDSYA